MRKVLTSKYELGLNQAQDIDTSSLLADLNAKTDAIRYEVARQSITLLSKASMTASRTDYAVVPLTAPRNVPNGKSGPGKIAYVGIGSYGPNDFAKRLQQDFGADLYLFAYKDGKDKPDEILKAVPKDGKYDAIVVGFHNYSLRPSDNIGISAAAINFYKELNFIKTITVTFGNASRTPGGVPRDVDIESQVKWIFCGGVLGAKVRLDHVDRTVACVAQQDGEWGASGGSLGAVFKTDTV